MDARVERLHAAAEHLRELGHALDARHLEAELLEVRGRAAARDELAAELGEPPRELVEPRLVVDRDQRAHSSLTTSGSSRCSTAWIRSSSVSRGSTGTGSWRITGARVEALVDEVHGDAGRLDARRERVLDRARARELGQQRRVDVDDPLGEAVEERRRQQVHVAGADDEPTPCSCEPVRHRRVALLAVGELVERETPRPAPRPRSARSSARAPGRFDATARDRQPGVEQRLQVRALAADEHADHAATIRPITRSSPGLRDDGAVADPEVEDAPQLLLLDVAREPVEDRRPLPGVPVELGAEAVREDARRLPSIPPPVTCANACAVSRSRRTSSR